MISPASVWRHPPRELSLGESQVHVWRASLDLPSAQVRRMEATLAADELERASRYRFARDRERFITARGLLRAILSRYLETAPGELCFRYGPRGKPALAGDITRDRLCFNVAHSLGLALYAVARGRDVGVDLERIQPDLADEHIAERFFSPGEVSALRALPALARQEAFFACWTRKESYLKARGDGLALELDQFEVSLAPGEPAALLRTSDDPRQVHQWSLRQLDVGPGHAAALAVEGHDWQLRCWQWTENSVPTGGDHGLE